MSQELTIPAAEQTIFQQMIAAAKEIDVDKLKILQEMHEHAQDREAERQFAVDFVRMKAHLPRVVRLKRNSQTQSNYAPLEDINGAIDKILEQFGFGTEHDILETDANGVKVKVRLQHTGGHARESGVIWMPIDDKGIAGAKNKTLPHAIASAVMYARRVGQCAMLNISTGDTDGNLPKQAEAITEEQITLINTRIAEFEDDYRAKFMGYMKVEAVGDITDFKRATNALDAKKKAFDAAKKKEPNNEKQG